PLTLVPTEVRKNIRVVLHNPGDQEGLQYLAADREARPIYMNRVLCEADFVLPITMSRLPSSLLYVGGNGGLFPTFSDLETQQRFRSPQSADHGTHQKHRRAEANEAVWNLGVHFLLQVVPGAGDELLHVVAGEARSVAEEARRLHIASWLHPNTAKAGLTIAAIDGDEDQQTWENFACALDAAMQCTVDGGTIVLLSNVNCPIGPALALLTGNERGETLNHHLQKEHSPDAQAAAILADARERFDLFLHSGLSAELVEELGAGHIADLQEVVRLAKRYPTITLLGSAQHAGCQASVLV
ncbi:MAG TPA: hypothetical protein VL096_19895, partial [Pirellulaceae bacterium]|nr:hypothetical protein [Pirellulaceae bacterium]